MQTRIHLVRHGRVASDWQGRVYGCLDVPLSSEGEAQLRSMAESLREIPLACVLSSGLNRAEFGAACLRTERELERRDEPELSEIDRGEWGGLKPEEIDQKWPGAWRDWWLEPARSRPPGGESLSDVSSRVLPCLNRLANEFQSLEIAIVAHSWVIRIAVAHALGLPVEAATRLQLPPAGIAVLDWPNAEDGALERPILVGLCAGRPPDRGKGWFRGPKR